MIELLEIMKALISGNTSTYSVKLLQRRLGEITLNFYISFTHVITLNFVTPPIYVDIESFLY